MMVECTCDECQGVFEVPEAVLLADTSIICHTAITCPHCGSDEFGWSENTDDE